MHSGSPSVLIVDDDHDVLLTARMFLEQLDMDVSVLADPEKLPAMLSGRDIDVVLLDMNFRRGSTEGAEGIRWLKVICEKAPDAVVILMTAFGDVDLAVKGIRAGAFDFILKPWQNAKLHASIHSALELKKTRQEKEHYRMRTEVLEADSKLSFSPFIGESDAMLKLKESIDVVAPTDASVLILGENGTGKEMVARSIHSASLRRDRVFLGVDMGAIPETLFESELFGHRKGAFTGAMNDKPGRFELAGGGTLFLDEIGNLPHALQSKLLTVLEQRTITRLGTGESIPIDIRLISATNQPVRQMAEEGSFRQDLLYRLNTIELVLPPLRERGHDIPLLAQHFLKEAGRKYGKPGMEIGKRSIKQLQQHSWPGNVRELQNMIARAVIMSDGKLLDFSHLGITDKKTGHDPGLNLEQNEKVLIRRALVNNRGNVTRAAIDLGIDRNALYRRMKKHGLQ